MYFVMLYRVWCSYHNYVKKTMKVKILWHHKAPFGSSLGHSSYFFKRVRLSLNTLMCCPCLFRMLGFDRSCISLSFPTRWSPYFSWCSGTCKDWYLSLLGCIMGYLCNVTWSCLIKCLTFQKFSGAILSSNAIFFDGPITWVGIYFAFTRCCFRCCANTFLLLCRSNNRGLVINSSYNPFILFIFCPFFITFHIHFGIPHLTILHFSRCQCGHTIDDLGIHLLCCPCGSECITTHDMFRDTIAAIILESGIHVQRDISHLFPTTHKDEWILSSLERIFIP